MKEIKEKNKNILIWILCSLLIIVVGMLAYELGKKHQRQKIQGPEFPSGVPPTIKEPIIVPPAIEEKATQKEYIEIGEKKIKINDQPDEAVLREYFSEIYLTRTEPYPRFPAERKMEPTNIFQLGDWFCLYGTTTKEAEIFVIFLDEKRENIPGHDIQFPPQNGRFTLGGELGLPVGKYEMRIYVKDVLVKIFPIEVKPKIE